MPVWIILGATGLYMAGLFAMAWRQDTLAARGQKRQGPIIYALALGVYCTSWTYFGAVGTAASSGWDYLPIYLGPALVFLFLPGLIRRIGDVAKRESVTSLSDFLSARYGKSQSVALAATLAAVAGSLPYIALQLKSVGMSFQALSAGNADDGLRPADETVLLTAIALAAFAILFGARHSDSTRTNPGLMRVLAFESAFKLIGLFAVCILSVLLLSGPDISVPEHVGATFAPDSLSGRFITITFLAMGAIICLPRQFHVAIIEREDRGDIDWARWLFPLYLLATSLVVLPITIAGLTLLPGSGSPDLFVLQLPLVNGNEWVALVVFLGGFSAATGMVIVSTVALSTMVTNDIIVPMLMKSGRFASISGDSGQRILAVRRFVIVALLMLAYGYYRSAGTSGALAQIGLLSFAAAVQFAPALISAVYWRGGRRIGVVLGLAGGMGVWAYTLFLPAVLGVETIAGLVPALLHPQDLLGFSFGDSLTHGVVWSLGTNAALFVIASLRAKERLRDRIQAAAFIGETSDNIAPGSPRAVTATNVTVDGLKALAARFLSPEAVDHAFQAFSEETGVRVTGDQAADWRLIQRTERLLASALGASSARVVMSSAIGGMDVALPDVLSILDQQTQAERFDRHMLQSMLENISQGISVVDHEQRLVAWNSAYVALFNYPEELVKLGTPVAKLIHHNLKSGWIEGDPAEEAQRRVEHMRQGRFHVYERQNPDGRYLRISGNPMPGGGYVTTFSDITLDKNREQELLHINETLEHRVRERTKELERTAQDRDAARADAEGANASKTRFLAAASHDLLQPLNAARLLLGAARTDPALAGNSADALAKTDKAIQSADNLLKGLLDISRLDHGAIEAQPVDIPLGPLLEDLVDEARPMADEAGIDIRVAPTRMAVWADPDFLTSILRNFISNARRYTRRGGVLVGARRRGDSVQIEVWDTGPGIPKERLSHLFEEFRRYQESDNLGLRGAGLGLSVASRLAQLMDAEISVRSWPGHGSVFSLTCPLSASQTRAVPHPHAPAPLADISLSGLRVLCVDDELAIREAMDALLSSWNCSVTTLSNYGDALTHFERAGAHVLIADLQLDGEETGLDLIHAIGPSLPDPSNAALLTARAGALDSQTNVKVFGKPADPEALRQFLMACAKRLRPQAAE